MQEVIPLLCATFFIIQLLLVWHIMHLVSNGEIYSIVPLKRYLFSKEKNNIKAGDLIFTRSSIGTIQEVFVPYIYKHTAIAVEFDNEVYIAETSIAKVGGRDGNTLIRSNSKVVIYTLDTYMKNILGSIFLLKLNKPLSKSQIEILQNTVLDQLGKSYPSLPEMFVNFILNIPIKKLQCISFVNLCLTDIGLIENKKMSPYQQGIFITNIYKYDLLDGYRYEKPKQLVYDYECNEELY